MNALEGKLEAMVITKPDRKTKQGKKQANRSWYLRSKVQKAKFQCKVQQGAWLRNQSCESYQEGKRQQKCETVHSGKVQHQNTQKYY